MKNYTLLNKKHIKEVNGDGYVFEHNKTKAKVLVIKNDDKNKTFAISFRTPPKDDTGVAHILEHSVLCGSKKYPVKDPFVELAKGSLNTFLNAMTFPDKTMYPIASTNDVEFRNLMDVYLDAVFYPNIYKNSMIFKQEGWHISIGEDESLSYNGVVYNEMKGACSSPEQVLYQKITSSLFGEHTYGYESGGEPQSIPDLSYEQFLDFHKTYYHPSNSYVFIYGDVDFENTLTYIDESYLKDFEYKEINSQIEDAKKDEKEVDSKYYYAVSGSDDVENKTYLSYNFLLKKYSGAKALAMNILEYILLTAQGAPLKEVLVKTGLFEDVYGYFDNGYKQPFFSVIGKHTNEDNKNTFKEIIEKTLNDLVENKIQKSKILSAINLFEFRYRESDYGTYPKGVIYSINVMENWLYGLDPFESLEYDGYFKELREKVDERYFENLIKEELLGSEKRSLVSLVGDDNLQSSIDEQLAKKLEDYKNSLTDEESAKLKKDFDDLNEFRNTPDLKEDYEKIPLLKLSDIDKKPEKIGYELVERDGLKVVLHKCFTNDIVYGKLLFDISDYDYETIKKVALTISLLGKIDTKKYSYSDLSDEINLNMGGLYFNLLLINKNFVADKSKTYVSASFKTRNDNIDNSIELLREIILNSSFDDFDRIRDLVVEKKSKFTNFLVNNGHSTAIVRSMSYHTENGRISDLISGIAYFKYIESLTEDGVLSKEIHNIKDVYAKLFNKNAEIVFINSEQKDLEKSADKLVNLTKELVSLQVNEPRKEADSKNEKEGFMSASKVNYNCVSGNFIRSGFEYEGGLKVLKTVLTLDYLWKNIRVTGGAYGTFCQFKLDGNCYLATYRDPKIDESYNIFDEISEYVDKLDLDEREIRKYIIGTIASLDTPLAPSIKGEKALSMYLTDTQYEDLVKERQQVLAVDLNKLRSFSELLKQTFKDDYICTVGSEVQVSKSERLQNKLNLIGK